MPLYEAEFKWSLAGTDRWLIKAANKKEALEKFNECECRFNPSQAIPDALWIETDSVAIIPAGEHLIINIDEEEIIE